MEKPFFTFDDYRRAKRIQCLEAVLYFLFIVFLALVIFFAGMMWERSAPKITDHNVAPVAQKDDTPPYIMVVSRKGEALHEKE